MAALRPIVAAILAVLCAAAFAQQADEAHARLTFPSNRIRFEIPIQSPTPAQITAELLDLVNQSLSTATATCTTTLCRVDMPPAADNGKKILTNDLGRYRIRYTIGATTGILAVDHIAPSLYDLHLAVADHIRPGASYTARIRALNPLTGAPIAGVPLTITLSETFVEDDKDDHDLAPQTITTDPDGFASYSFTAPQADDLESMDLSVEGTLGGLRIGASQTLNVPNNQRFDLTTDKPLYQPGQTVHTRMLLLDRNGHASPNAKVRVDIDDPDSTLVFRAETTTSEFGIATVDWPVPARMRLGQYRLEAESDGDDFDQNAYASIRLSRYDLPTFVVAPQSDRTFYLPGQNADVDVHADYLFGQPVRRGHVRVVRENDRTWNFAKQKYDTKEGKAVTGELDAKGHFHAHIDLQQDEDQYLDEDPSNQFSDLHYAAYVTDASTGRTEQRRFDLRVTAQSLHLTLSRTNQPRGLPGQYYLTATLADGSPAECDVAISLLPHDGEDDKLADQLRRALPLQHIHTDTNGLARLTFPEYAALHKQMPPALKPRQHPEQYADEPTLYLAAEDSKGHHGAITQSPNEPNDLFRITTTKSLYRPGDPIDLTIDSAPKGPAQSIPATLQILRHTTRGDLLLATRNLTLANGHAALTLPTDARFSGLIFLEVIALRASHSDNNEIATRAILFPRDNSLHVGIQMSAPHLQARRRGHRRPHRPRRAGSRRRRPHPRTRRPRPRCPRFSRRRSGRHGAQPHRQ